MDARSTILLATMSGVIGGLVGAGAVSWRYRQALKRVSHELILFANRELRGRLPARGPRLTCELANTINRLSNDVRSRLENAVSQRNELEAVLASMAEGMIAVDRSEKLISMNTSAARLLGVDRAWALHRGIQEVVRNTALRELIVEALDSVQPVRGDLVLRVSEDDESGVARRFVQARGTALRDASGQRIGVLVVLHDVTELRRLEKVRRDFVANVSHEIKTPVTAIKAAVETLLDAPEQNASDSETFMRMIARQSERLHHLVDQLLNLARIEQNTDHHRVALSRQPIDPVMRAAVNTCQPLAQAKHLCIRASSHDPREAWINPLLLEQAIVNLLDNAIKHSPDGTVIDVSIRSDGLGLVLSVRDQGSGIDPKHLPRIFGRFYRPDTARSRGTGGAGLGLAIVKHIAHAHRGRVSVDSQLNQGSTFRIHLPLHDRPHAQDNTEKATPAAL